MAFRTSIDLITDGENIEDSIINRPLSQLTDNDNYLKAVLDALSAGQVIMQREAVCESDLVVGMAAYYNSSTSQFERALADGTVKDNVVGICVEKPSTTTANLVLLGKHAVDFTAALESGSQTAARYFLSETVAGKLTSTRPVTYQNVVFVADGKGNVYVMPQDRSLRGAQGYQGFQGVLGNQGVIGNQGNQGVLGNQGVIGNQGYQGFQGYSNKVATKTSNYTAVNETVILCNATSGAFSITLPTAASKLDWVYSIKKIDSTINTVTVDANGSETIDDALTQILQDQYSCVTIISDGTSWWIL